MVIKTPKRIIGKVERLVRQALQERFGDEFVFDPIIVASHPDAFDDERVHIYVVYDNEGKAAGPRWVGQLMMYVQDRVPEEELPLVPLVTFIPKSSWGSGYREQVERWIRKN